MSLTGSEVSYSESSDQNARVEQDEIKKSVIAKTIFVFIFYSCIELILMLRIDFCDSSRALSMAN